MNDENHEKASILHPLIKPLVMRRYMLVAVVFIATLALLLPESIPVHEDQHSLAGLLYSYALRVSAIRDMALVSAFPFATAIAYFTSLLLGIIGAIAFVFTRIDLDRAMRAVRGRSVFMRGAIVVIALLLWGTQFMDQAPLQHFQISYQFFESAKTHRTLVALWCAGIFLITLFIGAWTSIELSNLAKGVRHS